MATTPPLIEPTRLRVGDTWQWRREDLSSDYPASTWTLTYYVRNAAAYFNVVAAADGEVFDIEVAAATTAAFTAGNYDWVAAVSDGTDRFQIGTGRLVLDPDLSDASADLRSYAQRMLDAIEALLEGRASSDELDLVSAAFESRSMARDRDHLLKLRDKFAAEVAADALKASGRRANRILAIA